MEFLFYKMVFRITGKKNIDNPEKCTFLYLLFIRTRQGREVYSPLQRRSQGGGVIGAESPPPGPVKSINFMGVSGPNGF